MLHFNKTPLSPMLVGLCLLPLLAHAQTAPQLDGKHVPSRQAVTDNQLDKSGMLDSDPRLKLKVTLRLDSVPLSRALVQLSTAAHISLLAEGDKLQSKKLTAVFSGKPLRDVLDAVAALGDYEWVGRKSGAFVLRAVPPKAADPQQAALDQWGKDVRGLYDKLTPEQKQALSQPYATPMSDLPPDMQSAIQGTLSTLALKEPMGPDGQPVPMYEEMLSNAGSLTVGLQAEPMGDGTNYYLNFALPGRSGGSVCIGHG